MTKKQQRLLYTVLIIGIGFYVWSQHGAKIAAWFSGLMGGGGGSTQPPPEEESGTIFGTLAGILETLGGIDFNGIFDGLFDGKVTVDVTGIPDDLPIGGSGDGGGSGGGGGSFNWPEFDLPDWLGGVPAGGAALTLSPGTIAQILAPIYVGTSDALNETLHDINVALPGDNTGLEMGNRTLMTARGPFILKQDGSCYSLGGQKITCPASSEIIGIEQHTLEWYEQLQEA